MHVNSGLWQFRPADDFARAVAQEVDNARVFRETFVGNRASDADYVLLGEITSTKYEGKIISYGLSAYGPLLWFFGFPARLADGASSRRPPRRRDRAVTAALLALEAFIQEHRRGLTGLAVVGKLYFVAVTAVNSRGSESSCTSTVSGRARQP